MSNRSEGTIAVVAIKKPRRRRFCEECREAIEPGSPTVRLYGCGSAGDPKYNIYMHQQCYKPERPNEA